MHRQRWGIYVLAVGALLLVVFSLFVFVPKSHAVLVQGNPGSGTGGSAGGGYHTSRSFGWKAFSVDGGGPSGGFKTGSWGGAGGVQQLCRNAGADKVLIHVVRNSGGAEKSFTFTNTNEDYGFNNTTNRSTGGSGRNWWVDRPGAGGDPYVFDSNGNPSGARYGRNGYGQGGSEDVVINIRAKYQAEGGSLSSWGFSVGWFCWHDNPPWAIAVTTTADKVVAEPGERITWTHTLRNNGANTTNRAINWRFKSQGAISNTGSDWSWASGRPAGTSTAQTSTYDVGTNDVGRTFCRSTSAEPSTNVSNATIESNSFCVLIAKKPKLQILGGDLMVGRSFSGSGAVSGTTTSITNKIPPASVTPPYNASMITGLWQTGVNDSGTKLAPGSSDPHWQLANVYRANANGSTLTPTTNDAHWTSSNNQDTCQPGPYPRAATVVNPALVNVGSNDAWKTTMPNSAWIGSNVSANNIGNSGACVYPGMSQTIDQATFAKASIWVFRLTNGFDIDACVDPATVRLNLNLSADDEVQVLVNGQTVAEPGNFRHYNTWPSTPVSYTTNTSSAFRNGSNSLEIRLKSAWQYTGVILNSISVAQAQCRPVTAGNVFGSWVEYGIFATGTINGTGSGSAFGGTGGMSDQKCTYSSLSFVNAGAAPAGTGLPTTACTNSTVIGGYSSAKNIPNVAANFPNTDAPVYANDPNSQGIYTSNDYGNPTISDPIVISAKTLQRGQWVVINAPNADVTITGNINYTNTELQSISQIPQMIIIAKNIYIAESVTNIDAWLIAKGTSSPGTGLIDTCSSAALPLFSSPQTINTCQDRLTVNGPVMAKTLWLRRTAGAGANGTDPAEVFNLRPDAYLWLYARASTSGRVQIVDIKELPPRF